MALACALSALFSAQGAALLGSLACLALIIYGLHPIKRCRYRGIPGPPNHWLVGSLPELAAQGEETAFATWAERYALDGVFKVFLGGCPHIVVVDPGLSRKVMKSCASRHDLPFLVATELERQVRQHSILLQNGEAWRTMRNAWMPFFSTAKLQTYFPTMLRCAEKLTGVVAAAADKGEPFDVWPVMGTMTLDVIATVAGGVDVDKVPAEQFGIHSPSATLAELLRAAVSAEFASVEVDVGLALRYLFPEVQVVGTLVSRYLPGDKQRKGMTAREFMLETFLGKLVKKARLELRADGGGGASEAPTINPESLLAVMSAAKDKKTGQLQPEMWARMQSYSAIGAGTDTTALLLAYSIYFLAGNLDTETKLLAEVDEFGRDRDPTFEDLQSLPYTSAVLQEALRLLPPGSSVRREAKECMHLGPYLVPKGAWLVVSNYSMQRSGRYWKDPLKFVPERFLSGAAEAGETDLKAHAPFGDGARACPGARFALQEATLALLRLYQRFTFRLAPGQRDLQVRTALTLCPVNGVHVTAHRRG